MNRKQIKMLALVGLMIAGFQSVSAQEAPKAKERKEIIIREKEGKGEKMTIVVDGDNVTINGKPLAEYGGDNIIIRKKNLEALAMPYAYSVPRSPRQPGAPHPPMIHLAPEAFEFHFDEFDFPAKAGIPKARLGVVSEKDDKGAKITEVMSESAASKAGLKEGDIITAVDGKKVDGPESLSEQIRSKKPDQESTITYIRDKKTKSMKVKLEASKGSDSNFFYFNAPKLEKELAEQHRTLAEQHRNMDKQFGEMERLFKDEKMEKFRSEEMDNLRWEMDRMGPGSRPKLGVRIEDMEDGKGVKVIDVETGSPAEKAGFKKDDILTHIDDKKISNTDQARDLLRESRDKPTYPVTVQRNGQPFNMTIKQPREMKKTDL